MALQMFVRAHLEIKNVFIWQRMQIHENVWGALWKQDLHYVFVTCVKIRCTWVYFTFIRDAVMIKLRYIS